MPGDVVFSVDADEGKAIRAFRKIIQANRDAGRAAEESGRRSKRAADQSTKAVERMGSSISQSVMSWATGFASMGSAVRVVMSAVEALNSKLEKGVQSLREMHNIRSKHAQISGGDVSYGQHSAEINRIRSASGMSGQAAGEYHFAMRSMAGMAPYMEDFAQLEGIASPLAIASSAWGVQKHFKGQSPTAVAGMLFRAAGGSEAGAQEIAPHIARYAPLASAVGAGAPETVAALPALSAIAGGQETAATQLSAFGTAVLKNNALRQMMGGGVGGGGFLATARRIQSRAAERNIPEHELAKGLPKQALLGYRNILKGASDLESFTATTAAPGADQVMAGIIATAAGDASTGWERRRKRAVQRELVREETSTDALAQTVVDTRKAELREFHSGSKWDYLRNEADMWVRQVLLPKAWEPAALGARDDWQERATRGAAAIERAGNVLTKGDVTTRKTSLGRE